MNPSFKNPFAPLPTMQHPLLMSPDLRVFSSPSRRGQIFPIPNSSPTSSFQYRPDSPRGNLPRYVAAGASCSLFFMISSCHKLSPIEGVLNISYAVRPSVGPPCCAYLLRASLSGFFRCPRQADLHFDSQPLYLICPPPLFVTYNSPLQPLAYRSLILFPR